MKIYFAGSISGGNGDSSIYIELVNHLKNYGVVLSEHVGTADPVEEFALKFGKKKEELTPKMVHDQDIDWLLASDLIVAEVTTSSLGVGYEIARAFENGKKVLCLYRNIEGKRISPMILGNNDINCFSYEDVESAKKIIDDFVKS